MIKHEERRLFEGSVEKELIAQILESVFDFVRDDLSKDEVDKFTKAVYVLWCDEGMWNDIDESILNTLYKAYDSTDYDEVRSMVGPGE